MLSNWWWSCWNVQCIINFYLRSPDNIKLKYFIQYKCLDGITQGLLQLAYYSMKGWLTQKLKRVSTALLCIFTQTSSHSAFYHRGKIENRHRCALCGRVGSRAVEKRFSLGFATIATCPCNVSCARASLHTESLWEKAIGTQCIICINFAPRPEKSAIFENIHGIIMMNVLDRRRFKP